MPRLPLSHSLPVLREALVDFPGITPRDHKTNVVVRELRQLASRLRTKRQEPFYSQREVAAHFGVSVPTIVEAYRQLEVEGLLIRKRGAMTLLTPVRPRSLSPSRGVVAIPFWIPAFLMHRDFRELVVALEEEIRKHGFVATLIFYGANDEMYPAFAYRVLAHKPDMLLWVIPKRPHLPVVDMVAEAGVQVLTVHQDTYLPFRGGKCVIDYRRPMRKAMKQWRAAGIREVVLPRHSTARSTRITASTEEFFRYSRFPYRVMDANGENPVQFLRTLPRRADTLIAFIDDLFFMELCAHAPRDLVKLMEETRVLITHPINLPPAYLKSARVDLQGFDPKRTACLVAESLHTGRAFTATKPVIVQAQVKMQVDAAELARHFGIA